MADRAFPIITVPDLDACVGFYRRLGFVVGYRFPADGDAEFVTLRRGEASLGVGSGGTARTDGEPDRFVYWVYVDDVDAAFDELVAVGVAAVDEPRDQPWGERVAAVRDPAGNLVHLGAES